MSDIERLADVQGLDQLHKRLSDAFGSAPARQALDDFTSEVKSARQAGRLVVAPAVGLVAASPIGTAAGATAVRANTFFGR